MGSCFTFVLFPYTEFSRSSNILEYRDVDEGSRIFGPGGISTKTLKNIHDQEASLDQINILVITKYLNSFKNCIYEEAFNGLQAVDTVTERAKERTSLTSF